MPAPTIYDSDNAQSGSSTSATTKSFTYASGDMFAILVLSTDSDDPAVSSVTTTGSNLTFADAGQGHANQGIQSAELYIGTVTGSSSGTITVNVDATTNYLSVHALQLRSSTGEIAFDTASDVSYAAKETDPSYNITTAEDDSLVVAGWSIRITDPTVGSGYTELYDDNPHFSAHHMTMYQSFASSSTNAVNITQSSSNTAGQAGAFYEVASAGVNIDATLGTLTLTSLQATVDAPVAVDATLGTLTLTSLQASVASDVAIDATLGALTLTSLQATVGTDVSVDATLGTLTLTSLQATVGTDISVDATLGALTLTSLQAAVGTDLSVTANLGTLTLTSLQSTVGTDLSVTAALGTLTLTSLQAAVGSGLSVAANLGTLTLTSLQAVVDTDLSVDATLGSLTLTSLQATVGTDVSVTAGLGTLTLTSLQASVVAGVNISANLGTLTLTSLQASVVAPVSVDAALGVLTLTSLQASVGSGLQVAANLGTLTLTSLQAAVDVDLSVTAALGTLTLTSLQASIVAPVSVDAALGVLTLTGLQASVGSGVSVTAGLGTLTLTSLQASVVAGVSVTASLGSLTLTSLQATVVVPVTVDANLGALTLTSLQATVGSDVSVTANLGVLTLTSLQASIDASTSIDASLGALTLTSLQASVVTPVTVTAGLGVLTLTSLQASVQSGGVIEAGIGVLTLTGIPGATEVPGGVDAGLGEMELGGFTAYVTAELSITLDLNSLPSSDGIGEITFVGLAATPAADPDTEVTASVGELEFYGLVAYVNDGTPRTVTASIGELTFVSLRGGVDDGLEVIYAPSAQPYVERKYAYDVPIQPILEVTGNRFVGRQNEIVYSAFHERVNSFGCTTNANGGYWSASINLTESSIVADDWIRSGVGREITMYNGSGSVAWQGFVNTVSVNTGAITIKVGPLLEVVNELALTFQTRRYNTNPPIGGIRYTLDYLTDVQSQVTYGYFPGILNGGTGSIEEAEAVQQTLLAQKAWPEISKSLSGSGGGAGYSIDLECVGYAQYLSLPVYANLTGTLTQNVSDRMIAAIESIQQGVFETTNIRENTLQVGVPDGEVKSVWEIIKSCVVLGDANNDRWIFGVYEDGRCEYREVDDDLVKYDLFIASNDLIIRDVQSGTTVEPWDLKPGYWMRVNDISTPIPVSDPHQDASLAFIESITYNAPWDVAFNGGRTSQVSQQLAKLGVGGTF
jgi:hypothetical protein